MIARGWLGGALLAMTCAGCNILLGGPDYKVTTTSGATGGTSGTSSGPSGTTTTSGSVSNGTTVTATGATVSGSAAVGTGPGATTTVTTGSGMNPLNPVQIASDKGEAPSGLALSQHIIYALGGGRYWFFYADLATPFALRTRISPDFVTWVDGPTFSLPYDAAGDSRTFSVAYARLGNADTVHIAIALHNNNLRDVYYVHGVLTGNSGNFTTAVQVSQMTNNPTGCDPEEPGITVDSGGFAHIITGWWNNTTDWCDFNLYDANTADQGSAMFSTTFTGPTHQAINGLTNTHAIVPFGSSAIAFSDSGDVGVPNSSNVNWASLQGTTWNQYNALFEAGNGAVQSRYDWTVCAAKGAVIDVVRRLHDGTLNDQFEYMVLSNGWGPGAPIPPDPGLADAGIVLLHGTNTLGLFAIGADPSASIRYTTFSGQMWTPWQSLVTTAATRNHLAGSGCADLAHPTLIWTQVGAPSTVFGLSVASLLP